MKKMDYSHFSSSFVLSKDKQKPGDFQGNLFTQKNWQKWRNSALHNYNVISRIMNFHSFGTRVVIGTGKKRSRGPPVICHMFDRRYQGPSIKDVGIFGAIFDTPYPCRNINPLPSDILQHRKLRYSDVFYGWPPCRLSSAARNLAESRIL